MRNKIAYIEDSQADFFIFQKWGAENGYDVDHFCSLEDLYEVETTYDLIVSDLNLISDFGIDVPISIKKNRPSEPFIIMTGMASGMLTGDICKSYMDEGAANVVPKDIIMFDGFSNMIQEAIGV